MTNGFAATDMEGRNDFARKTFPVAIAVAKKAPAV